MPTARSSVPVTWAAALASDGSPVAPSAMLPGNRVTNGVRDTIPCSSSTPSSSGIFDAFCSAFDCAAVRSGVLMFSGK